MGLALNHSQQTDAVRLTVDLEAVRHNYRVIAGRAAPARAAAVIKANAYGLGAPAVSAALWQAGCRDFFVAHLSEAMVLSSFSKSTTFYILNGLQPGEEDDCARAGFIPVINSLEQAERWRDAATRHVCPLPAVFQVDSGMSRFGFDESELASLAAIPGYFAAVPVKMIMSHLACSDVMDHAANTRQRRRFLDMAAMLPPAPLSLANSGGVFLGSEFTFDMVRSGLALLGVDPAETPGCGIRPVVQLQARVVQVRTVQPGAGIGYGLSLTARRVMRIATVSIGYADGWPRRVGNIGFAYVDGLRLPIVGRVSMDSLAVDVSSLPQSALRLGSLVQFIGPDQTLETVADGAGAIPYEILTGLGRRHAITYLGV